jgi:hypothetical protein
MPSGGLETTIKIPFENIEASNSDEPLKKSKAVD